MRIIGAWNFLLICETTWDCSFFPKRFFSTLIRIKPLGRMDAGSPQQLLITLAIVVPNTAV